MPFKDKSSTGLNSQAPKFLLTDTTRWALSARLAITIGKAGGRVVAISPNRHPLSKTSAVEQTFLYHALDPLGSLTRAIKASNPTMVVPCDDRAARHLHELHERAAKMGEDGKEITALIERSLGDPASYSSVTSRFELLEIAREEGILVPRTKSIRSVEDINEWGRQGSLPWVLKADGTFGGRGVRIIQTPEQANHAYLEMTRPVRLGRVLKRLTVNRDPFWIQPWWDGYTPAVIAQSHVAGRPANCAVVCWQGKVLAGIAVEVVSAEGLTGPANIVRVVDGPDMMVAAERIARRLKLSGFFGLDFMIEDSTRAAYLIEMNPRCTPLCHFHLGRSRDMAGAILSQLSGQPYVESTPDTQNELLAYFPQPGNVSSELLQSSFQDHPEDEPELVRELLNPWPDRSLLFRLSNRAQNLRSFFANLARGSSHYSESNN